MTDGLRGRTAVVTGASKGIGLAIVRALAAAGARVVAGSRSSTPELDALVTGGGVTWVAADLADPGAATALIEAAGGRVGVLVNNVGSAPARPGGFLVLFLAGDRAANITGSDFTIDGGLIPTS